MSEPDHESPTVTTIEPPASPARDFPKWRQIFWTAASVLSMIVNVLLIVIVLVLLRYLFDLNKIVEYDLIGGLHDNFVKMDAASIKTTISVVDTIKVDDTIPVVFDLPLQQDTIVTLTENVSIPNTIVYLNGIPVYTTVVLPSGTPLSINLDLVVPVSTTIPVVLDVPVALQVPVDIPLNRTELHEPFVGLRDVVSPYRDLLADLPDSWQDFFGGDK